MDAALLTYQRHRRAALPLLNLTPARLSGETFTRASAAYETGSDGVLVSRAVDVLRRSHYIGGDRTMLLEGQRTNLLPNSTSASSQVVSLAAGTYTLSAYGDSASASGAVDGAYGSATNGGTGATPAAGTALTFTVSILQDVTITPGASIQRLQVESGSFASSYIATAGATASRAADSLSVPFTHAPQPMTVYARVVEGGTTQTDASPRLWQIGGGSRRFRIEAGSSVYLVAVNNGASLSVVQAASSPSLGDAVELRAVLQMSGVVTLGQSINGGAEAVVSSAANASAVPSTWDASALYINSESAASRHGFNAFRNLIIVRGEKGLAYFRARAA
jgi:hypothetical protein